MSVLKVWAPLYRVFKDHPLHVRIESVGPVVSGFHVPAATMPILNVWARCMGFSCIGCYNVHIECVGPCSFGFSLSLQGEVASEVLTIQGFTAVVPEVVLAS